jgi:hypothetical protein
VADDPETADQPPSRVATDAPTTVVTEARTRPAGALGWYLLGILVVLALLLAGGFRHVDLDSIADEGWRNNALWASGLALVLLGLALGVLGWTVSSASSELILARLSVVAATLGVVIALVVLALADEEGGQLARSSVVPAAAAATVGGTTPEAVDQPLTIQEARDPENVAGAALPVDIRTIVAVDLTVAGRRYVASEMGCRPGDLNGVPINAIAIGGTWAQPLLLVRTPVTEDGRVVARCRQTLLRLPLEAGVASSAV